MESSRMSNADIIQYCNEALQWEALGPIDIYFFESVKKIVLGECSVEEEPDIYDIPDVKGMPIEDTELECEYCKFEDLYYNESETDAVSESKEETNSKEEKNNNLFGEITSGGFFTADGNSSDSPVGNCSMTEVKGGGFTVNIP